MRGQTAKVGEFPWQISLRLLNEHHCGGALISKQHVLTAAHCVFEQPTSSFTVIAGSYSLYGFDGKVYLVAQIVTHPYYQGGPSEHDIAVITVGIVHSELSNIYIEMSD